MKLIHKLLAGAVGLVLLAAGVLTSVPQLRAQGIQLLTTLSGTEQFVLNYPCTVSCGVTTSTLASYIQAGSGSAGTNGQVYVGVTSAAPKFSTMSQDCTIANTGVITCTKTNNVSFGTAAVVNTGTSGATIPLLNGVNTWAAAQTFTAAPVFTDASGSRTALGLGTAATVATGTSGATIPLLNGDNTYSGQSTFSGLLRTTYGTPTIASGACGTTTNGVVTSGTNQAGLITIGAASTTTCTVSFSATLAFAPNACVLFPASAGAAATGTTVAYVSSVTTSQFVISGSALATTAYRYICI